MSFQSKNIAPESEFNELGRKHPYYYHCLYEEGQEGCTRVICNLCQQIRVKQFQEMPLHTIEALTIENQLKELYFSMEMNLAQEELEQDYELQAPPALDLKFPRLSSLTVINTPFLTPAKPKGALDIIR